MSRKTQNECVSCGLPCLGNSCPNRHVTRYYCDDCGEEEDELYDFDGYELCERCTLKRIPKVR